MKYIEVLIVAILTGAFCAQANTDKDILNGMDRRSVISLVASNATYIAESGSGVPSTSALWVCSKITTATNAQGSVTVIMVMPDLQAPGLLGTNLPSFTYPN